ncbi:MAG: hypothetical protein Q7U75_12895 [Desulfobacterales bacterium]|nr:hypothetical protein [Desulfobacterales bacterium]
MATRSVDGSGVLYHYLQKDLIQSDVFFFQMLIARLVVGLGIWLSPSLYGELPILVPYAVRDPHSRGNRKQNLPDAWGSPNERGYFRDDNSLVKKVPGSLRIRSRLTDVYAGRTIGNGFVASHVWRQLEGEPLRLASRDPLTYSFVPNLVWLPNSVAALTDREGSFAQAYIQALSYKIFRDQEVRPEFRAVVEDAWSRLPVPAGIPEQGLPAPHELNFFEETSQFVERRRRMIADVAAAARDVSAGSPLGRKVISERFTSGLPLVERAAARELADMLDRLAPSSGRE